MNRIASVAAILLLGAVPIAGNSEPASDSQMASEALSPYVTKDPARRQLRLEEHRDRLYHLVQDFPDEAQEWMDLSTAPFLIYSVEIFGAAIALQQLQDDSRVASVMLNLQHRVIDDFQNQKQTSGPNVYKMPGFLC